MRWHRNHDGSYVVSGMGPMRPIAVEASTRAEAREAWMEQFGRQYEEQERHTALAIHYEESLYER